MIAHLPATARRYLQVAGWTAVASVGGGLAGGLYGLLYGTLSWLLGHGGQAPFADVPWVALSGMVAAAVVGAVQGWCQKEEVLPPSDLPPPHSLCVLQPLSGNLHASSGRK
jgi:hypothetical protein